MKKYELTDEWIEYPGHYQKKMQDIRTKDGSLYTKCWPNAGIWNVMSHNGAPDIPNDQVTHVRLTEHPGWNSPNPALADYLTARPGTK